MSRLSPRSKNAATGILRATVIACLLAGPWAAAADAQNVSDKIGDFLVMDVCVDASGGVLAMTPLDRRCRQRRNIRPGERIPYHLHDYPVAAEGCAGRLGTISKDNIPVTRDGAERVVSFYDHGVDHTCPNVAADAMRFGEFDGAKDGGSVQWFDKEFGFIMGSWSPVALSHWRTPLCELDSNSSLRFMRGWVIGPTQLPPLGGGGAGVFKGKMEHGDPALTAGSCPTRYGSSFTAWVRDAVTYTGGARLDSLVSSHYSRAARDGTGLGESMQVERTYWTKELGLTRWEKWAREDWVHPRNGHTAADLAKSLKDNGSCGAPYAIRQALAPDFRIASEARPEGYAERVTSDGEDHLWYMTLCHDYSNLVLDPAGGLSPKWGDQISPAYWAR